MCVYISLICMPSLCLCMYTKFVIILSRIDACVCAPSFPILHIQLLNYELYFLFTHTHTLSFNLKSKLWIQQRVLLLLLILLLLFEIYNKKYLFLNSWVYKRSRSQLIACMCVCVHAYLILLHSNTHTNSL